MIVKGLNMCVHWIVTQGIDRLPVAAFILKSDAEHYLKERMPTGSNIVAIEEYLTQLKESQYD